ncbi:hypothetical protein [Streptomyces palmae]|uniref:Secreted protein n=1 Tax=Streptomyces palmae TaxID=1701085 RepID=A0A4Z0H6G5_9ACTN|nr:hypothetical protein [Streptomyces palmae]TGB08271.1 hypothetical protein E4099_15760 [Streptomyces palmae]
MAAALTAAALALSIPLLTGCDSVRKAVDCARLAVEISNDVNDLQSALTATAVNPDDADRIIDSLDRDLAKLDKRTDNTDVGKAVDNLQQAVDNVRTALDRGEKPDLSPVAAAAGELTDVCTPG